MTTLPLRLKSDHKRKQISKCDSPAHAVNNYASCQAMSTNGAISNFRDFSDLFRIYINPVNQGPKKLVSTVQYLPLLYT